MAVHTKIPFYSPWNSTTTWLCLIFPWEYRNLPHTLQQTLQGGFASTHTCTRIREDLVCLLSTIPREWASCWDLSPAAYTSTLKPGAQCRTPAVRQAWLSRKACWGWLKGHHGATLGQVLDPDPKETKEYVSLIFRKTNSAVHKFVQCSVAELVCDLQGGWKTRALLLYF